VRGLAMADDAPGGIAHPRTRPGRSLSLRRVGTTGRINARVVQGVSAVAFDGLRCSSNQSARRG